MYDQPRIPEEYLRACCRDYYDFFAVTIQFLPLGLDSRTGVYRVVSDQGTSYLLKARSGAFYEPGCLIPCYLRDQGIAAVVAPLPSRLGTLWTRPGEWTVIVYPFLEGETGWNPALTDAQWQAVGAAFKQIHQARLPAEGVRSLRKETFDPTGYRRSLCTLETQYISTEGGNQAGQALRSCWLAHRATIGRAMASLEQLAGVLQKRSGPYVICHADVHPGNIIRSQPNQVFVIDWDEVMLAPRERDFLFVGEAPADGASPSDTAPFFRGYGPAAIDWTALTYYLWERLIQDVIAFAEEVFSRDDLSEAAKADSAALFQSMLSEAGGVAERASAAAAHLPIDLDVDNREIPYQH